MSFLNLMWQNIELVIQSILPAVLCDLVHLPLEINRILCNVENKSGVETEYSIAFRKASRLIVVVS